MEKPKELLCIEGISCMSYNKDFSACVLSKKDNNLYIYQMINKQETSSWVQVSVLQGHLQYITSVDWHAETNRIISSSQDRNIIVWNLDITKNTWVPQLVNLKVKVSVLDVKWNLRGDKFVATTGSKLVSTGYFDEELNMWTCRSNKDHRSSVTCARFDNSGLFIISGSTDMRAIISSGCISEIDDKINPINPPYTKQPLGEVIKIISLSGWVNCVAWSPSNKFAFIASHDAVLTVVNTARDSESFINLTHSPISHLIPLSDSSILAIGYDKHIYEYECDTSDNWKFKRCLTKDSNSLLEDTKKSSESGNSSIHDRMKQFSGGIQKKGSLIITSSSQRNVHSANVSSAYLLDSKNLITSDLAGFVKIWKI